MSDKSNEPVVEEKRLASSSGSNLFAVFLSLLALTAAGCVAAYNYMQYMQKDHSAANNMAEIQSQLNTSQSEITNLQQAVQKAQETSAKQEQIIADWQTAAKGDLSKVNVSEAQYFVKLANDHLEINHNVAMAITLLQRADQSLQKTQDPAAAELHTAVTNDITALQAITPVDVSNLYAQLSSINSQLDKLPLPANPIKPDETQAPVVTEQSNAPWYQLVYDRSMEAFRKIVVVRNIGTNAIPLVMPEEKSFLYQNLHAQMENVMWAVLQHNSVVYEAGLTRMIDWINTYFDQNADVTKSVLQSLQELQKVNLQMPATNLTATLQLFDSYLIHN